MRRSAQIIQSTKQPYFEDAGPQRIESIRFSTFSDTEILKTAEVEVIHGVYYNRDKMPIDNGLLDLHMGPANKDKDYRCKTCCGTFEKCPGHYGYLALALPVYNVGYFSAVVDIMKCICKKCSRILLEEKERLEFLRKMRNPNLDPLKKNEVLKQVVKKCNALAGRKKAQKCSRCGYINGMVKKAHLTIQLDRVKVIDNYMVPFQYALSHTKDFKGNINVSSTLDPRIVHHLLKNMLDEDCELLYLDDRPEKLIIANILVPPIAVRPSSFVAGGTQRPLPP